ncbi:chondroitin sulfate proteoglycan 5-like [Eleutherodactylus coqui]|uniref:chondroitin sulfate proteoglycan 5-like n=1 Tax=Eleutherodactylus coqui TaxID=57060 RepID=UPI003461C410
MTHNPGPIYCKPGYKENGGVCKSQCDVGGLYCGDAGQCVIVENVGAMCRCQQMSSLCYGGECCRSSLTTFQLACVIGGCCILLSVFLASLPYLIRRMDIKAISKSVRTRLWISNLMPRSTTSSTSQSVDFTVCSDYASLSDHSTYCCTKEMARNSTVWQYERTRL